MSPVLPSPTRNGSRWSTRWPTTWRNTWPSTAPWCALAALGNGQAHSAVHQLVDVDDPAAVRQHATEAAAALVRHDVHAAIVTAGAAGAALAARGGETLWITAPRVQVTNPV